eukprot:scaffold98579_cov54-Attheya_sp.AAC.3
MPSTAEKSGENLVLNYHDAVVYQSDLELLDSNTAWLNDACINFQMTRLQQRHTNNGDLLFMDPSVISFMMHQCDDEDLADLNQGLHLETKKRIFVPINDNYIVSADTFRRPGGGSHWSLLVILVVQSSGNQEQSLMCYHFDSGHGSNFRAASAVADVFCSIFENCGGPGRVDMKQCITPHQNNGYDCGIYTLAAAEAVAQCCATESVLPIAYEQSLQNFVQSFGPEFGPKMRKQISDDIRSLA